MPEKETPFVTAFLLMLKLFNYPVPMHVTDMFHICQQLSNALYLASYSVDLIMDHNPKSYDGVNGNSRNTYDFIIVGGGTAGSLVAARLLESTRNRYKVLVLETGAEPTWLTHTPFFNMFNWNNNATSWDYHSAPQSNSAIAARKSKVRYTQYKGLGGTMNYGHSIYNRGNPKDYDAWVEATGDNSWSYKNLTKFFKKTENYRGKYDESNTHGYSRTGTLSINIQGTQPLAKEWTEGGGKLLNNTAKDPNENQVQTFVPAEVFIHDGRRQNTYDHLLKRHLWRKNLKITRYALVTKILFSSRNYARGVIYRRNHENIEVRATKEIILCAGVFNTPKLLLQSGIGPAEHLRQVNIKVKKNLPHVGQNLQDQPTTYYGPVNILKEKAFLPRRNLTYSAILEYYVNQSGILGWNMMSGIGFYSTPNNPVPEYPNIGYTLIPLGTDGGTHKMLNTAFDLKHAYLEKYLREHKDNDAYWVKVTVSRPKSTGLVGLRNDDPHTHPIIDPNFFADKDDLLSMVEGVKFIAKLQSAQGWSALEGKLISTAFPGCEQHKTMSTKYIECWATHLTVSTGNTGGTCRMGKTKDDSVVDSKLLVHKVKRLRIVDASVMPVVPNGATGTAVMMVAEKASDMILEKWDYEVGRHRDRSEEGASDE